MACARSWRDLVWVVALAACGSPAVAPDATPDALDKSATCASAFGSALTNAFGRVDGTIVAVVPPNDQACALPNMTHLVIQVQMAGAVQRLVVDVLSNQGTPVVDFFELDAPLLGGLYAEGWHPGLMLDYPSMLGVHAAQFVPTVQADLVAKITAELALGAKVSIFGTSMNEPTSAHLIHRGSVANQDGAIVIDPDTHPHWLLIRFDEQTF